MTDFRLNYLCYGAILESIHLCSNKWLNINRIIRVWYKYLKPFLCVERNELLLIGTIYFFTNNIKR